MGIAKARKTFNNHLATGTDETLIIGLEKFGQKAPGTAEHRAYVGIVDELIRRYPEINDALDEWEHSDGTVTFEDAMMVATLGAVA